MLLAPLACGGGAMFSATAETAGTTIATESATGSTTETSAGDGCPPGPSCRDQALDASALQAGVGGFPVDVDDWALLKIEPLGDVNGDGFADIGLAGFVIFGEPDPAALSDDPPVLAARGFPIPSPSDPGIRLDPRPAGDVNGDGRDDVLVLDKDSATAWLVHGKDDLAPVDLALVAAGEGGFVITGVYAHHPWRRLDRPGVDVDGDGLADLALDSDVETKILRGQVDGAPIHATTAPALASFPVVYDLTATDLDGDGGVEVVVCGDELDLLRAPDGWDAPARVTVTIDTSCDRIWAGDVDADGYDDLILGNDADLEILTRILQGPLDLAVETIAVDDECYFFGFAFADIDGDGDAELLAQTFEGSIYAVYIESYAPKETCEAPLCSPSAVELVASVEPFSRTIRSLGDFNGDGRDDLLVLDAGAIMTGACEAPP
jgi:hypothetical protein